MSLLKRKKIITEKELEAIKSSLIARANKEGKTICTPYSTLTEYMEKLNPVTTLKNLEKTLNNTSISIEEKHHLIVLGKMLISQLHCGICKNEEEEFLSLGMVRHFCSLTNNSTRTFDEVFFNIPCTPNNCPIKQKQLK